MAFFIGICEKQHLRRGAIFDMRNTAGKCDSKEYFRYEYFREREREGERDRETERQREKERETERQRETERDRERKREREGEREKRKSSYQI